MIRFLRKNTNNRIRIILGCRRIVDLSIDKVQSTFKNTIHDYEFKKVAGCFSMFCNFIQGE
jgi:hypothetical protein